VSEALVSIESGWIVVDYRFWSRNGSCAAADSASTHEQLGIAINQDETQHKGQKGHNKYQPIKG
jgi:hypothetical protein